MTIDNNVLHNLILETLMAINIYMVGNILFQFTRRGKKAFLVLSLCKCSLWNVLDMALLTQGMVPDGRIQVALNLPILIFFLIILKIFSGYDWLKVFLGSVIEELLTFPPLFLYLCVYRIWKLCKMGVETKGNILGIYYRDDLDYLWKCLDKRSFICGESLYYRSLCDFGAVFI